MLGSIDIVLWVHNSIHAILKHLCLLKFSMKQRLGLFVCNELGLCSALQEPFKQIPRTTLLEFLCGTLDVGRGEKVA